MSQIMKTIISTVLSQEKRVEKVTLVYLDEIYINKNVSPVSHIQAKFAQFGLDCKDPEHACWAWMSVGRKALFNGNREVYFWAFLKVSQGGLFFPVQKTCGAPASCGWLRTPVGVTKHRANVLTSGRDNQTSDALLTQMIAESVERVTYKDPTWGEWCIKREEMNVWVDASSLVLGVL